MNIIQAIETLALLNLDNISVNFTLKNCKGSTILVDITVFELDENLDNVTLYIYSDATDSQNSQYLVDAMQAIATDDFEHVVSEFKVIKERNV